MSSRRRRHGLGGGTTWALALLISAGPVPPLAARQVLRIGVTDGSQPCSYREADVWRGLAVDIWNRVASEERLPFVLEPRPSTAKLLEAVGSGELDVAVGCLNVSPERLDRVRFSLPFQEGGQAVLIRPSRLDVGRAILLALLSPDLLRLLGGYLAAIALVTLALWRSEQHACQPDTLREGRRRSFARVFQILATGPGTNTIAFTTRGHSLVVLSYLIRIVAASLLVSYVTLNVVRQPEEVGVAAIRSPQDLAGRRVAARPGSVSEDLLRELSRTNGRAPVTIVPLQRVSDAAALLTTGLAEAVLADELQLRFLIERLPPGRFELALRGIRPESQAFALSPSLSAQITARIDRRISAIKRSGAVSELREAELRPR